MADFPVHRPEDIASTADLFGRLNAMDVLLMHMMATLHHRIGSTPEDLRQWGAEIVKSQERAPVPKGTDPDWAYAVQQSMLDHLERFFANVLERLEAQPR